MLLGASIFFVYYTIWSILLVGYYAVAAELDLTAPNQPFLDASSPVHDFFPRREWAVRIPALLLVFGLSAIGCALGFSMVQRDRSTIQSKRLQ